jgi:peroxiredoxin
MSALLSLPAGLPEPIDDGACNHLTSMTMPDLALPATSGQLIHLATGRMPRTVIYCYPMTGQPGKPLPDGWDEIPGARGCTPQACSFRDHHRELLEKGAAVFGLSTQSTTYQQEATSRLHLPFDLLSDEKYELCDALQLPTFVMENRRLIKRLTLIVRNNKIEKVFYPVFPPDQHAAEILRWLEENPL